MEKNIVVKLDSKEMSRITDFVRCTSKIDSDVLISSGHRSVDGKSIVGILTLDLSQELIVKVIDRDNHDTVRLKRLLRDYSLIA